MLPNSKIRVMREGDPLVTQEELLKRLAEMIEIADKFNAKHSELEALRAKFNQDNMNLIYDVRELEEEYSTAKWRAERDANSFLKEEKFSNEDIPF